MNTERDLRFDGLKFIMIFLVVLGHLGYNDYGLGINGAIYAFHMPVFIFLSGYFTSLSAHNNHKQWQWLKKTFLIYIFAQLTHFLLRVSLIYGESIMQSKSFNLSVFSWKVFVSPELALWYLICLIYWRIAIWKVFNKVNDITLLIFSIVLLVIGGIIPIDHNFAFQRALSFFPFFALGIVFKKRNLIDRLQCISLPITIIAFLAGLYFTWYLPMYMPKYHYENWHQLILRLVQSGLGLYLCLLIIRLSRIKFIEKFAKYGKYTLWIYIGHIYLITLGEKIFPYLGISLNLFTALLVACIYCTIFIYIAELYKTCKKH